jgi:hypothetical protein
MTNIHSRSLSSGIMIATVALLAALGGSSSIARADWTYPNAYWASPDLAFTTLTLQNGWTGGPFNTNLPAVAKASNGIVYLKGAMATGGTNPVAFTLPTAFRPHKAVYVTVDMCNASSGRLFIDTTGIVTVQTTTFSNAACFTSLDGVVFAP